MKKVFVFVVLFATLGFVSCSDFSDENLDALLNEKEMTRMSFSDEYDDLKAELKNVFSNDNIRTRQSSGSDIEISPEDIEMLNDKCLEMFKAEGFAESEFDEFRNSQDLGLVAVAVIYMGFVESNAFTPKTLKTRSADPAGEDTCWDPDDVLNCITQSLVGVSISEITALFIKETAAIECLTKATALTVAKNVAKVILSKLFIGITIAAFITDFSVCMFWP